MVNSMPVFFDHSHHKLWVRDLEAHLDVLAFKGEEHLSQPFTYTVEFTSTEQDITAEQLLRKDASFSLYAAKQLPIFKGLPLPKITPLRTLHGVVTAFKRLSASVDEARYELTLQPRLALLDKGRQFRIFQHQSVPEIVESILRNRHDFEYCDFLFRLVREYPRREQVMQYGESDFAFINRLLAEVGIWYRFTSHERLNIDVVEFCDDQRGYQFNVELPHHSPAGLSSSDQDGVWSLQSSHAVVEKNVHFRAYHHRDAKAHLDSSVDQTRGAKTTYGEAYHYAEPYRELGDAYDQDEDLKSESGYFYARLRHERYLNDQTHLSGISSSATLAPGQVLTVGERDAVTLAHSQLEQWQPWLLPISEASPVGEDPGYDDDFQRMREEVNELSGDRVTASKNAERHDYVPFSSFRHKGGMLRDEAPERYFHTRLKQGANGLHDTWLILGGEGFDKDLLEHNQSLSLRLTGTNGQLPRKALQSTLLDTQVHASDTRVRVRNLCTPTLPCYPPQQLAPDPDPR